MLKHISGDFDEKFNRTKQARGAKLKNKSRVDVVTIAMQMMPTGKVSFIVEIHGAMLHAPDKELHDGIEGIKKSLNEALDALIKKREVRNG